ncbi:MAG: molybdopterin-guanine dinucleotide biosynthesis protein B [Eggerthellaceae bacterium]|nr:molybdopterin-guanine dinucleotide biosynthesis protein B [Eggerthellaceae bacterium]
MIDIPSPAIAVVGRHNSGKTTLIEKLIAELVARGHDVGSVKHHHKTGFEFDVPGKDSYRHRQAGASETVIAAPDQIARVRTLEHEVECSEIVRSMPGHDIIVVEGYRKSGLPTIEIMRSGNPADAQVAEAFVQAAEAGESLGADFTQKSRGDRAFEFEQTEQPDLSDDLKYKMPTADTVAIVTDIPEAERAADIFGIPHIHPDDVSRLADFVEERYARPKVTVVIQAGGESRRMGRSKATVPFAGRPLICRLVERLAPAADELVITTNEAENLAFLHEQYPDLGIRLVPDEYDYRGALPGLYTALTAASNPFVAVVACDMVFASPRLVVAEAIVMKETGAEVVVPVNKHGYEPFHGMYRRQACLPAIQEGLDEGEKRAQYIFGKVRVREFTQDEVLAAEPMGGCFVNANTPGELQALEDGFLAR